MNTEPNGLDNMNQRYSSQVSFYNDELPQKIELTENIKESNNNELK